MQLDRSRVKVQELKIEAQKKIEFFEKLHGMTERVKTFNQHFSSRMQRHEINFQARQEKNLNKEVQNNIFK